MSEDGDDFDKNDIESNEGSLEKQIEAEVEEEEGKDDGIVSFE